MNGCAQILLPEKGKRPTIVISRRVSWGMSASTLLTAAPDALPSGSNPIGTEECMQNANLSQQPSEEQGSRIPDTPPQPSAKPAFAPASTIERAAQRLDWTIAFGMRHNTPPVLEETTNQQPRPNTPRIAWASWLTSSRARGPRLLLISRLCLASVLITAAAGTGILLFTHSAGEKATAESALETEASAKASEATSLIRGLAIMPPAAGTAQNATLAGPAPIPAASEWEAKLTLGSPLSAPGFASPAPRNQPTVPAFSAAEVAGLLARGDWLFATGDVASARLLYERAADAGEARAAVRLGETFDPVYLHDSHLRSLHGDPGTAVFWYRRAYDLGATGVASRLKSLEAKQGEKLP